MLTRIMSSRESREFSLSDYVNVLLQLNASSNASDSHVEVILKEIKNDIKQLKKDIRNTLHSFGYDHQLWSEYECSLTLNQRLKEIEKELNQFNNSDLLSQVKSVAFLAHEEVDKARNVHQIRLIRKGFEELDREMRMVKDEVKGKNYSKAIGHNDRASQMVMELYDKLDHESINDDGEHSHFKGFFALLDAIKSEINVNHEQIIYDLKEIFKSNVKVERNVDGKSSECEISVNIRSKMQDEEEYQSFIEAIVKCDLLDSLLAHFLQSINTLFLKPLLDGEIGRVIRKDKETITTSPRGDESRTEILKSFILFLSDVFHTKDHPSLAIHLGRLWKDTLFQHIIDYYLKPSIPKSKTEIVAYKSRIEESQSIRQFLISNGFLNDSHSSPFNEFMSNIDSHFLSRMCHDYIYRAKQIICLDLSETTVVGETHTLQSNPELSLFLFPKSRISLSILELLKLMEEILKEMNEMKDKEHTLTLHATIRNICELYLDISPVKHKKLITDVPQQTAIFHNNCLYLAHSIQLLLFRYSNAHSETYLITLLDFMPIFRQLGSEIFLKHLKSQEKILLGFMQDPLVLQYLFENANNEQTGNVKDSAMNPFEQAIRRCIKHLSFLQTTFVQVLPPVIHNRAIGTLANTILCEIIHKVSTLDDISSQTTTQLSNDFAFIIKEMPKLFDPSIQKNVSTYIPKWIKFGELKFILTAGLAEILDRWADGHGPLAAEFSAEEVKGLIRALFQNTDRRAMTLNKIKASNF